MKNKTFLYFIFILSTSSAQVVDLFISDWYIGWRGDGVYNNLVELYNPKEDTINLTDYLFRRTQNGSGWLSTDADHMIRLSGIIPPGGTFAITRAAADEALINCANQTTDGGEDAGYVDPDAFLKQNGNDAFGVFYIGGLGDDTTAWIENGVLLDALGNIDDGSYWDVSGTPEATRYHILQRKFNICGGNSGDWNSSRGCIDDDCTETSYALSEWEVINCALADPNGANYPEPESQDASQDMEVVCGGHQYLCLGAPNSPPGEFALEAPVTNSNLFINEDNLSESLDVSWFESYDSDGHDLVYTFDLYNSAGDTVFTSSITNEINLEIPFESVYNLIGVDNSLLCYWDVSVTDLYDTTGSSNGPFLIQISTQQGGGLDQPPAAFNLEYPSDYTLFYINPSNVGEAGPLQWEESLDPDGNNTTYYYIVSHSPDMSDLIGDPFEFQNNSNLVTGQVTYDYLIDNNLNESAFYWDIIASDGVFEQSSSNGPFMAYWYIGEDPSENEETFIDLFISDWYIGYRSSPTYNAALELYNPKDEPIDLSNYILRRTQNGSHWMESSWIRLDGVLPPRSTYVLTRQASDESIQNCADNVEPDEFLKHNGDDGIKITHIGYLPEVFQNDTTAWMKMSITLDAIGNEDEDPGSAWGVSGVSEATRYYMLTRKMDVCGGNGGDWNSSRGCLNETCDSTSFDLGEWTPIQCGLSPSAGDMPEGADASSDVAIFCGNHNYFCSTTAVDLDNLLPQQVELYQNYPNPFNPRTEIYFDITISDRVEMRIFNILGNEVKTLVNKEMTPGKHIVYWSGKDNNGLEVSSGMYFYKLKVGEITKQKKLILLR